MNCLLFSKNNLWSNHLFKNLSKMKNVKWDYCNSIEDYRKFNNKKISWAFFFHWNHLVPSEIYELNRCVVLHTSNLPDFRGGSPIQNQIIHGVVDSNVNAIKMSERIDGGPIYDSIPVSLQGSLTDIWLSISNRSLALIKNCVKNNPTPKKQESFNQVVKRRKTCEIPVSDIDCIEELYDYIRMLDAKGYENSFVKIGPLKIKLSRAKIIDGSNILADALIEWDKDENFSNSSTP